MVVFVLRHADRQPNPDDDLTLAGIERVKLLHILWSLAQ